MSFGRPLRMSPRGGRPLPPVYSHSPSTIKVSIGESMGALDPTSVGAAAGAAIVESLVALGAQNASVTATSFVGIMVEAVTALDVKSAAAAAAAAVVESAASTSPVGATSSSSSSTPFLNARTGLRYTTLKQAVGLGGEGFVAQSGDTIKVAPGTYVITDVNSVGCPAIQSAGGISFGVELPALTIEWEVPGQPAIFDMSAWNPAYGIQMGSPCTSLTLRGLHFIGRQENGSCGLEANTGYPYNSDWTLNPTCTLTVEYCKFKHWADGILMGYGMTQATLNVRYCWFEDCTQYDGLTHGIYCSPGAQCNVIGCFFTSTAAAVGSQTGAGHFLKSRARSTTVYGNLFAGGTTGGCACCVELPCGGDVDISGNILLHYGFADHADENPPIKYGYEQHAGGNISADSEVRGYSIKIAQNTIRKDEPNWDNNLADGIGMLWVATNMTHLDGSPRSAASVSKTLRNNILAGNPLGPKSVSDWGSGVGTAVARNTVDDSGVYSGSAISGSPALNDAQWSWTAGFTAPNGRTDTYQGGLLTADPAWRQGMAANTWKTVSTSQLTDVDPEKNAAINPNGVSNAPWHGTNGQQAHIGAWGSTVWDEPNRRIWTPIGGGHGNYGGNEPYMMDLSAGSPVWVMKRNPSGAIGNLINFNDGQESSGVYSDGRPRSTHVYNNIAFVPGVGPMIVRIGSAYPNSGGSNKVWKVDQSTGETTLVFDLSSLGVNVGGSVGSACYDPSRNRVYSIGSGSGVRPAYVVPQAGAGAWAGGVLAGSVYVSDSYQRLVYLPAPYDRLLALHGFSTPSISLIHPDTGAQTEINITGSYASGFDSATGAGGMVWAPRLGKLLLYGQTSNAAQISTLTPTDINNWVAGALTVSGSNTLVPPVSIYGNATVMGTFGYSDALRGCYYVHSNTDSVYFYATE
jgi:hypothetical protein